MFMNQLCPRWLYYFALSCLCLVVCVDVHAQQEEPALNWHSAGELGIEGRGFPDTVKFFDRLPARAEEVVRPQVWNLSRHASGIQVLFKTNSPRIHVRYRVTESRLAMPHMPATSVSGVDMYSKNDEGQWRWAAVLKPASQEIDAALIGNIAPPLFGSMREFRLYLPLYNGIEDLEIGIADGTEIEPLEPAPQKPVVFYGTSIMHGACASRSGMSIPAILGRRLEMPIINLGFSGNGRMEKEVGQFICELNASVFVIDCLPNMNAGQVTERCIPLVRQLRASHPETPILLVEDRVFTNAWVRKNGDHGHRTRHDALHEAFHTLVDEGDANLYYLSADDLLGSDHEAATDGSHPSDLGMMRYADAYEPVLRDILESRRMP